MVWSIVSAKRRRRLVNDAARSRTRAGLTAAWVAIIVYNVIGGLDIYSTAVAVGSGAAMEANPLMRLAMESLGPGWITAKLLLQFIISGMVLWFPHRIVLTIFVIAVAFNAGVVYSNLQIAGIL